MKRILTAREQVEMLSPWRTASRRIAMPWQDWYDKVDNNYYGDQPPCAGNECEYSQYAPRNQNGYQVTKDDRMVGNLMYNHSTDDSGNPKLKIDLTRTAPNYRRDGVAEALLRKMIDDHPGVPVDFGFMTPDGRKWHDSLLQKEPKFKNIFTARRFWAGPAEDAYDNEPDPEYHAPPDKPNVMYPNPSGRWYHVSPHELEVGTVLTPGGGDTTYNYDDRLPSERQNWVWMDGPEGLDTWFYGTLMSQIQKGFENPLAHIYEVEPSEGPHPWNGTGWQGHVAPSAKIIRKVDTNKHNFIPEDLNKTAGKNGDLPEGLTYSFYGRHPFLGDNWAVAKHDGKTIARLYWNHENHPEIPGEISLVQVHPDYRRRGIASEMVRRVREDIDPNIKFSPVVSPDGKAWSEANGYKPPKGEFWQEVDPRDDKAEWRTAQRFWAMADTTPWHPHIEHTPDGPEDGVYSIHLPDEMGKRKQVGELIYSLFPAFDWDSTQEHPEAYIHSLIVHPDHQGKGIAQALVERLHRDNPDHKIDPGATTVQGNGLTQRLRNSIPGADQILAPDYIPSVMNEDESRWWTSQESDRLWKTVNARLWAGSPNR